MSVSWKQCEGQVINNTFPLQRYLGGSDNSGVFLTQLAGPGPVRAAIKLIPADHASDLQLSLWRRATQLSHPNLLRVLQSGRCQLEDSDMLYVVMEYTEEDLSQILPERPLTAEEARQMLEPVLGALSHLHGQGLVHSHLKPSNILAIGDQLKLSTDTIFPVGETRKGPARADVYSAPESANFPLSPAADSWSLGMTLVEALTQLAPSWRQDQQQDPSITENIPQPFLDIARHTLRVDLRQRWTIAQIAASLNPVAVAAAAAQSISPLSIPVSSVPAVPAAKLQAPKPVPPTPKAHTPVPQAANRPKQTLVLPNYVLPIAILVLVIVGIFALPKILNRRPETTSATATPDKVASVASATSEPKPTGAKTNMATPPVTRPAVQPAAPIVAKAPESGKPTESLTNSQPTTPASLRMESASSSEVVKNPTGNAAHGEILDQVLPQVSDKALATIHGTVRVTVLLQVDAAGNVSQAEFDSPGPSQYFADLALKASRRWEFTSPEVDGRSVPSQWRVRFEFAPSGVKAFPKQTAP
ncbi:MAG TPA: TonB family protein [Methylomirabilota bacterium]|nr:TonB family protein [Methylomirabilota bacterium]